MNVEACLSLRYPHGGVCSECPTSSTVTHPVDIRSSMAVAQMLLGRFRIEIFENTQKRRSPIDPHPGKSRLSLAGSAALYVAFRRVDAYSGTVVKCAIYN